MNIDFKYNIGNKILKEVFYVDKPKVMEGEVIGQKAFILGAKIFLSYLIYFSAYGPQGKEIELREKEMDDMKVIYA